MRARTIKYHTWFAGDFAGEWTELAGRRMGSFGKESVVGQIEMGFAGQTGRGSAVQIGTDLCLS